MSDEIVDLSEYRQRRRFPPLQLVSSQECVPDHVREITKVMRRDVTDVVPCDTEPPEPPTRPAA